MLHLLVKGLEFFDEETNTFSVSDDVELDLEHSLVSLSKWESFFEKPFLSSGEKTPEEILAYVKMMIITPNINDDVILSFSQDNIKEINDYINSPQSATTFGTMPEQRGRGETITAELIYYWMVAFNIPFECQNWHINRLFALIRICNIKNSKPKKMGQHEIAARNRELNAKRREQLKTSG